LLLWISSSFFLLFFLLDFKKGLAQNPDFNLLVKEAYQKKLADHPYWLKLLHYYKPGNSIGQWNFRSDVISHEFFLDPNGNVDPFSELKATIQGILNPLDDDLDQHTRCKFIARTQWLLRELNFPPLEEINCPLFERWSNLKESKDIKIIFVSAFLKNPASTFGHILIQFNSKNRYFGHKLLSPTLNFGAIVNPEDGAIEYALRGLLGGYNASYSDERFYSFNHMYGENEQRDLWAYELNLSKQQRDRIIFHTWELLQKVQFTYYFFLDNCAYRMAELLEMAWTDDTRLNSPGALWAIPIYVIHNLKEKKINNKSILGKPELIPSRQRRLQNRVNFLTDYERDWLKKLVSNESLLEDESYIKINVNSRARILDAWIDYLQYKFEGNFEGEIKITRNKILSKRSKLPILEEHKFPITPPDPSTGSRPTRFRFGFLENPVLSKAFELGIWSSHHDLLGEESGHLEDSEVVTLDLRLHIRDNKTTIDSFTLLSIQNLSKNLTGIPGDAGLSWRFQGGFKRKNYFCLDCTIFNLSGGLGKSVKFYSNDISYLFIDLFGQTESSENTSVTWGLAPHIGMLWEILDGWKIRLEGGWYRSYSGPVMDHGKALAHQRWTLSQNLDLRLEYDQIHDTREGKLALNFYW
tara:strand:- start:10 stop:1926 length:1917 start_codon:yes stop_codon:yes gene_type:complete